MRPGELIAYWQHGEAIAAGSPLPENAQRELYTAATFGHLGVLATAFAAEGLDYEGVSGIRPGELGSECEQELHTIGLLVSSIYAHTSRSRAEEVRQTIATALPYVNEKIVQLALGRGVNLYEGTTSDADTAVYPMRNTGALYVAGKRRPAQAQLLATARRIRLRGAYPQD